MALKKSSMARVSGTDDKPVSYKVVGSPCQLRPGPNFDYYSIGAIRKGNDIKGFPFVHAGMAWVRLTEDEAAIYVPDPARREDGVWLPQVHPKYGRLVQSKEEVVRYGATGNKSTNGQKGSQENGQAAIEEGGKGFGKQVTLKIVSAYEEMLQAEWSIDTNKDEDVAGSYVSGVIEMVIDMASGRPPATGADPLLSKEKGGNGVLTLRPAKGAIVKRVEVGSDLKATVSNMPDSRYFLISVVVTFDGHRGQQRLRSRWVRAATLNVDGREGGLGSTDPGGNVRGKCEGTNCACAEYVPMGSWNLNSDPCVHCRRCGCPNDLHAIVGRADEVGRRAAQVVEAKGEDSVDLPREASSWDEREKNLWLWSNGALHPRNDPLAARKRPARTVTGVTGRVSVVCPTMEERQVFHEQVWGCFTAQDWPDKELIVIETFQTRSSDVFRNINDDRLVYLKFRCGQTTELSIGAKRNIAQHIASGDYIANFDDDDIYAPTYLSTLVRSLHAQNAAFITLSNWYFFDIRSGRFGFFDALEYARVKKMREKDIDGWLWGYGFSYFHKLQPALDKKINYRNQNMEEDIHYIRAWKSTFGDTCTVLHDDNIGIVCHTLHGRNTSNSFALREVPREEMWDTDVADLSNLLGIYLGMFPRQAERSRFIEYEADTGKVTRRGVHRRVQWLRGTFLLSCNRGATGGEIRLLSAQHLGIPPDSLRVHRNVPTGGFVDVTPVEQEERNEPEQAAPAPEPEAKPQEQQQPPPWWVPYVGTWVYGAKATEYILSIQGETLHFEGPHSRVGRVYGAFAHIGLWFQTELASPDGDKVGMLRLKWSYEADKMITNFRSLNREDWGKDIHAHRKADDSAGAQQVSDEPPPPPPQLPPSSAQSDAPLHDDERVGAYVEELWLVLTSAHVVSALVQARNPILRSDAYPPPSAVEETSSSPSSPASAAGEALAPAVEEASSKTLYTAEAEPEPAKPVPIEPEPLPEAPKAVTEERKQPSRDPAAEAGKAAEISVPSKTATEEPAKPQPAAVASATAAVPAAAPAPPESAKPDAATAASTLAAAVQAAAPAPAAAKPVRVPEPAPWVPTPSPEERQPLHQEESDVHLVVHIDQALNFRETIVVERGATILSVKRELANRDLLGMISASDIRLAWEPEPHLELSNQYKIKGDQFELVLMGMDSLLES